MSTSLYDYSREQASDTISRGKYISISTCLQPPLEITFNIHSFGDERDTISQENTEDWVRAGGLDAFLDFSLVGYVSPPDPFIQQAVEVKVNPLWSLPRFSFVSEGLIGRGFHDGARFSISLYLPLDVTKELLAHVQSRGCRHEPSKPLDELLRLWNSNRGGWQGEEHRLDLVMKLQDGITGFNPEFANLRFDLCDVRPGNRLSQDKTIYNVCRLYA